MSSHEVMLVGRLDPLHGLVREKFRTLALTHGRCAHDITDRFLLRLNMEQWTCAVRGALSVICFQAFLVGDLLDVSAHGGGIVPTPECRLDWDDGLHRSIELFCGGFSGWTHVTHFLHELEFPLVTCLALDIGC